MQKDYEKLFAGVPCGILQMELPFGHVCQIYRVNPRAEEIMKVHFQERQMLKPEDYLDEDNLKYAREILRRLKKPGDRSSFLLKTHHSAIEGDVELIRLSDGHELLQCMFFEVGGEIQSRKREAQHKELLERVLNSVSCGILRFTFEGDEQKITLANPAAWKLLGFEKEEDCLHKGLNDILPKIHPEDRVHVLRQHCMLTKENEKNEYEFRVSDGHGGYRRLEALQQCLRDSDGNHLLQVTLTDITLQHQIMQQKKEEDRQVIQSLGMVYFMILQVDVCRDQYRVVKDDFHGERLGTSGCYSEKLKQGIAVWGRGENASDAAEDLSLDYFRELYRQGKTSWEQDYFHPTPGKKNSRYIRVALLLSGNDRELQYVTVAARDITELHQREMNEKAALRSACEAAREASRAKTEFLSNMSHDIRTPMNAISGFTQIMERHLDSPQILKENLTKIRSSYQVLLELINDVLDVSRIESGKMVLDEQPVKLKNLVEEVTDMIRPSVEEHGHRLDTFFDLSEGVFLTDALRIRQILMNLLSNAVKFTPDGGNIYFGVWEEKVRNQKYRNIHFQIRDNGIGMTQEFQQHIFEPFERAQGTESTQGSGLGMTITHNLIHLMNGVIEINSQSEKGSCFDVMIPVKCVETEDTAGRKKEEFHTVPDWHRKRILVVEDNEINMEIACTFLQETGVMLETAVNGKEAVEKFSSSEKGYYSLILMDVQMPVMNGYEATRAIRNSSHPDAERIPVIAMTANAFSEDVYAARQAGMNEHLAKPVELEKMYRVLRAWMPEADCREEEI